METETTWIDAWIRWDRNSKETFDEDDCDDEERVPPTAEFSFKYQLPVPPARESETDEPCGGTGSGTTKGLTLTLKGFPSESEQIWNSTGLTLWPSSHYLCEYLLDHYRELLSIENVPIRTDAPVDHPERNCNGENDDEAKTMTHEELSNEKPREIRAVELGSGLGRCGLLLHHLMAIQNNMNTHVYLTDGDTDTLAQLRDNVVDNTNTNATRNERTTESMATSRCKQRQSRSSLHNVSCHQLLWGRDSTGKFCQRHFSNSSTDSSSKPSENRRDLDNHHHSDGSSSRSSVDLVFGSDLVYAPRVIGPLFETVSTLLKNGNRAESWETQTNTTCSTITETTTNLKSTFLMAHSDRREGSSVTLKMVLEGAESAGLEFEILETIEREGIYIIAFKIKQPTIP